MAHVRLSIMKALNMRRILTRENLYALLICLMLIAIVILTASQAPQWIYQGF